MSTRMDRDAVVYRLDRLKLMGEIVYYDNDIRTNYFKVFRRDENGKLNCYQEYFATEKIKIDYEEKNILDQKNEKESKNIIIKSFKKIFKISR